MQKFHALWQMCLRTLCRVTNWLWFSWDSARLKSERPTSQEAPYPQVPLDGWPPHGAATLPEAMEQPPRPTVSSCLLVVTPATRRGNSSPDLEHQSVVLPRREFHSMEPSTCTYLCLASFTPHHVWPISGYIRLYRRVELHLEPRLACPSAA